MTFLNFYNLFAISYMTFTVTLLPACLYSCESEHTSAARSKYSSGKPCSLKHSFGVSLRIRKSFVIVPISHPQSSVGDVFPLSITRPLLVSLSGKAMFNTPPHSDFYEALFRCVLYFQSAIPHVADPPHCEP